MQQFGKLQDDAERLTLARDALFVAVVQIETVIRMGCMESTLSPRAEALRALCRLMDERIMQLGTEGSQ